jgi:hypothetical protein
MWTAVSTIAGALRRKVWLDMGFFEWTPNFYIILVGPPGIITKSTTINIGMDLLRELNVNFGPSVVTWQALITDLAQAAEGVDIEDNGIIDTSSPVTIAASEFGTFLDPRNREFVDVLVDLWDGKRMVWEKKTKTSGNDAIQNPWINLITATTPSWLAENMPESMIGGGFTSRCVFVFGDTKSQYNAYPARNRDPAHAKLKEKLLADLEHISMMKGTYTLTDEAYTWGEKWYIDFHSGVLGQRYAHLGDDRFAGYRSRRQTHMHKLAIILAAAESDERIITATHLQTADELLTATERDSLPNVFNNIGKVDTGRLVDRLLSQLSTGRKHKSAIVADMLRVADPRTISDVIAGCTAANLIRQEQHGTNIFLELVRVAP